MADGFRAQPGLAARRDRPHLGAAAGERGGEPGTLGVVEVDHRRTQAGPGEELGLGLPVGRHVAVVVEMVLGEVGEHGQGDAGTGQAVLGDADRRRLDRAGREAAVSEIAQGVLQRHRVGRGQAGGHLLAGLADAQGADHAAAPLQPGERLGDPPGGRGLAVGAGDGDDIEPFARHAEKAAGEFAGGRLQAAHGSDAGLVLEAPGFDAFGLHQAATGTGRERGGDEASAVGGGAGPGDEGVAGAELAAVDAQAPRAVQREPGVRRLARTQPHRRGFGH